MSYANRIRAKLGDRVYVRVGTRDPKSCPADVIEVDPTKQMVKVRTIGSLVFNAMPYDYEFSPEANDPASLYDSLQRGYDPNQVR